MKGFTLLVTNGQSTLTNCAYEVEMSGFKILMTLKQIIDNYNSVTLNYFKDYDIQFQYARTLCDFMLISKTEKESKLYGIETYPESLAFLKEKYPQVSFDNYEEGKCVLAVTQDDIENNKNRNLPTITIDNVTKTIDISVLFTKEESEEITKELDLDCDFSKISFCELEEIITEVKNNPSFTIHNQNYTIKE